jgi:predicted nucleic acid-binding Zn ribbon protein
MRDAMAEFSRLGDILNAALSRVAGSDEGRAYQGWARAAGADVVAVTRPRRLARGLLTVECESSTWANELTYLTPVILERLRSDDPATPVQSLRFVVGRPHRDPEPDDE